jgi:hypothetical protein
MGRSRMMGAGNASSSLYRVNPNIQTGGGSKKQGLVSYVGVDPHAGRALRTEANGTAAGRSTVTVQNQLSGVTSSQFNRASSFARPDGVRNRSIPVVPVPSPLPTADVIAGYTDEFIRQVTLHNSVGTAKLFCPSGILWGTVSQIIRQGIDIERYFDYFVNLEEIAVRDKAYRISQVPNSNVWINNALVRWTYIKHGDPVEIVARMQFTYDEHYEGCLYELYSAELPAYNDGLVAASGKN